jgi:Ser/Thr protein kinase RdoA (MazF antagonist)
MNQNLQAVARHFVGNIDSISITPLGNGLINDTYLLSAGEQNMVLQCINQQVFPQPQQVVENLQQLDRHLAQKAPAEIKLQIPKVIATRDGRCYQFDAQGHFWRALQWIHPAESRETLQNDNEAEQIGFALGHFHRLCSDLTPLVLVDTLPGFHVTPVYHHQYLKALAQPLTVDCDDEFEFCRDFIAQRSDQFDILEAAKQRGELRETVIHGDPKLNNFLFRPGSGQVISLIDLDTVKPGLVHYDIGDCLRSSCRVAADNSFDLERCRIILRSYLQETGAFFSRKDYDYLYPAIWLIPLELGLRFFCDYLQGNRYFKTAQARENLHRAQAQFALCASIEQQRPALEQLITGLHKYQ